MLRLILGLIYHLNCLRMIPPVDLFLIMLPTVLTWLRGRVKFALGWDVSLVLNDITAWHKTQFIKAHTNSNVFHFFCDRMGVMKVY